MTDNIFRWSDGLLVDVGDMSKSVYDQNNDGMVDAAPWNGIVGRPYVENVTVTVGSGKDYETIQGAIDFFKGKTLIGTNQIVLDPGNYSENLIFTGYFSSSIEALHLVGDPRLIPSVRYCASGAINIPIMPVVTDGGDGNCNLSNSGNTITVTGSASNPDFSSGGIVAGDKLIIGDNSGNQTEHTVASVSGNTISLTATAPTIGAMGSFVTILPDRRITSPEQLPTLNSVVVNKATLRMIGVTIHSSGSNGNRNIVANNATVLITQRVVTLAGSTGFLAFSNSILSAVSCIHCYFDSTLSFTVGFGVWNSTCNIRNSTVFQKSDTNSIGFSAERGNVSYDCRGSLAVGCQYAFRASWGSTYMDAIDCYAINSKIGFNADLFGNVIATNTIARNNSTIPYDPPFSGVHGNGGSIVYTGSQQPTSFPVFLTTHLQGDGWDGKVLSTTSKTPIDTSAIFGVPAGVKAVLIRIQVWDSGSAASTNNWFGVSPNNTSGALAVIGRCQGRPNNSREDENGWCPCNDDGDIYYQCNATGSNTMSVDLQVWGYAL